MKKEIVEKLLNTISKDTSGKWINISEIETLIENTVRECIDVVEATPRHCALTTHDLGTVACTIGKSVDCIHEHYDLKKIYKIK